MAPTADSIAEAHTRPQLISHMWQCICVCAYVYVYVHVYVYACHVHVCACVCVCVCIRKCDMKLRYACGFEFGMPKAYKQFIFFAAGTIVVAKAAEVCKQTH
jgi:hypothetical protein